MRILHVVPYYDQAWAYGGIPRLATTMTRALARRGHHVSVCTTDVCDERTRVSMKHVHAHGVDVRVFRNLSNRLAYHLQLFTPLGLRGYMRHAARSFDVVHIHACHNVPGVIAAAAAARAGVPYVVSPNGTALPIERRILAKRLFALTAGRSMLSGASRVVAVSRAEARQLRSAGVAQAEIVHIGNPIDDHEFEDPADAHAFRSEMQIGEAPIVLFLGKLTPRKGVSDLVTAFAELERPGTRLVIAGNDMGTRRSVESLVMKLRLEDRVIFTGLLTGRRRLDALAAATVVVYPSRDEVFGLVPLEALLCGTPVVVCDDSGCGEVISITGGGQVVPHGDVGTLAAAIDAVIDDEHGWRNRARAGAIVARQRFGSETICTELESLYKTVVAEHPASCRMSA
jgi:glycosyltransferase involved in cell wall biosynthesis